MHRRRFLELATSAAALSCDGGDLELTISPRKPAGPFAHGVASGDPLADRVILWTRVSVEPRARPVVRWLVAEDEELTRIVAHGSGIATPERDHTLKVDVIGLVPGREYHYAFELDGVSSPVGRTRTLPTGAVDRVRFAVASCANYPAGFFNVYAAIASRDDIDAVLHVGDYLYEYANGDFGDGSEIGRIPMPEHECITLDDYRRRHATYKLDPDLQELHRRLPFVVAWDDHEIANNAWPGGARNHQSDEGDWEARKSAAVQAYREWMPIRDVARAVDSPVIHRTLRWGDLVDVLVLETRLCGRDARVTPDDPDLSDPGRSLLGDAQEQWLLDRLEQSHTDGVAWRVLAQQVRMGQSVDDDGKPYNMDSWDGYPAARDGILAHLERLGIRDVVVVTGDQHSSWAMELRRDPFASPPTRALGVELITPAVSSPTSNKPVDELLARLPHVSWIDTEHRGYVELELTREGARATWHLTHDVSEPGIEPIAARAFAIPRGEARLVDIEP